MSQTSYSVNISAGRVGEKYDIMFDDVKTAQCAAAVLVGSFLAKDPTAADGIFRNPTQAADITGSFEKGFVMASHTLEQPYPVGTLPATIPALRPISLVRKGRMWVLCEDVITAGVSLPYVRYSPNGGNTNLGSVRGSTDTGASALANARFITSTTAVQQLAVLEFDL